jgi:fucose permease
MSVVRPASTLLLILIYAAFISLGLPDALLGSAWPVMQPELAVSYSYAGLAQMLISGGTILSSVLASRLLGRFGTGGLTAVSVLLTATGLFAFALAPSFWWLLPAAPPLGLGTGAVDAGLNAYVASHFESRHMSWLHSFWGVGALSGPLLLSTLLMLGHGWRSACLAIGVLQMLLDDHARLYLRSAAMLCTPGEL